MSPVILANIKNLRKYYIIHIIFNLIIIIFNYILLTKIIWLKNILYYLYLFANIFNILFFIIPIIPLIFILLEKLTKKNIKIFQNITLIFCTIAIIFGIFFSIILMMNAIESPEFSRECPFNLEISYLNTEFSEYFDKNIDNTDKILEQKCSNRRCALNEENQNNLFQYEYICNYDPTDEYEELNGLYEKEIDNKTISTENIMECKKIEPGLNYNFKNEIIYNYYDICNNLVDFYVCERFNEASKYSLDEEYICPNVNYIKYLVIFCILNVFVNLIISFFPWKMEYNNYKTIIYYYRIHNRRVASNSLNSTKNSSKIDKDNIENKFEKAPTEIIIVCNGAQNNIIKNNLEMENHNNNFNGMINNIQINKIKIDNNKNNDNNNKELKNEDINKIKIYNSKEEKKESTNVICNWNNAYPSERVILEDNKKE